MHSKKAMVSLLTKCWKMSNLLEREQLIKNNKEFNDFESSQIFNNKLLEQSIKDDLQNYSLLTHSNNNLEYIFSSITKVLKSAAGEVYWFKILRYEPIILEMFTRWLHEHNIIIAFDIVKQYCNIHSICFVHFKTNHGSSKKYL